MTSMLGNTCPGISSPLALGGSDQVSEGAGRNPATKTTPVRSSRPRFPPCRPLLTESGTPLTRRPSNRPPHLGGESEGWHGGYCRRGLVHPLLVRPRPWTPTRPWAASARRRHHSALARIRSWGAPQNDSEQSGYPLKRRRSGGRAPWPLGWGPLQRWRVPVVSRRWRRRALAYGGR
jgi:hypothetical protein